MCYGLLGTADERHSKVLRFASLRRSLAPDSNLPQIGGAGASKKSLDDFHDRVGVFDLAFP